MISYLLPLLLAGVAPAGSLAVVVDGPCPPSPEIRLANALSRPDLEIRCEAGALASLDPGLRAQTSWCASNLTDRQRATVSSWWDNELSDGDELYLVLADEAQPNALAVWRYLPDRHTLARLHVAAPLAPSGGEPVDVVLLPHPDHSQSTRDLPADALSRAGTVRAQVPTPPSGGPARAG